MTTSSGINKFKCTKISDNCDSELKDLIRRLMIHCPCKKKPYCYDNMSFKKIYQNIY